MVVMINTIKRKNPIRGKSKLIYDKRNKCYYDMGTKNKSFIQVVMDLKTLGIKNCFFALTLYDPTLVDVNPYDENLTKDQIDRIIIELSRNPWYYLREVVRIPQEGGTTSGSMYRANRGNISQAWCIIHGIDSWLCLPRQQGKTVSVLCIESWAYIIGTSNSKFIFINKDGDNAKSNLNILKTIISILPKYLRCSEVKDEDGKIIRGKNAATEIKNSVTGNTIVTKPRADSVEKATSLARGLSAPILHFDEPAFTHYIKCIVGNSASTFDTASTNAKANGGMYARIFTCTPGDLDTDMGMDEEEILSHTVRWSDTFYDKGTEYIEKLYELTDNCNKIVYIEFSYKQIGKDEAWLRDMAAKIGDPLLVRRELLLQRLHGSSLSPFPQEDIEAINTLQRQPIKELWIDEFFKFDIYEELDRRIPYLIGVDCSTGTNGDNNAITIINPYTLKPDAEFESNYIGETRYEHLLISLITQYIPKSCLCIERNSVGDGIIDHLLRSPIANRIYYDKEKDVVESNFKNIQEIHSMLKKEASTKRFYGVYTGVKSRDDMMAILAARVNGFKKDFVTRNITRDLSRLVRTKSGRVEAGSGFHDDSIMSYLIAFYVYTHGNNLELFGITKSMVLEAKEKNMGLIYADEVNPNLVDENIIEQVKHQEQLKRHDTSMSYENVIRRAIVTAQKESKIRKEVLGVEGSVFDNTDEVAIYGQYDTEPNSAEIDSFFDEINDSINNNDSDNNNNRGGSSGPYDIFDPSNYWGY